MRCTQVEEAQMRAEQERQKRQSGQCVHPPAPSCAF